MDIKEILKDLKEFSDDGATEYGYEMPLSEVREVIKALERTRWIPASERLPDKNYDVLALNSSEDVFVAHYGQVKKAWFNNGFLTISEITHWMPLPKPPEVE